MKDKIVSKVKQFKARNFIVPIIVLVVWEIVARYNLFPLWPSLELVFGTAAGWIFGIKPVGGVEYYYLGAFSRDVIMSFYRVVVGYAIGGGLAVVLGIMNAWNDRLRNFTDPFIQIIRPIPRTAYLPFMLIIFGIGDLPAIMLVVIGAFLMTYVEVLDGASLVQGRFKRAASMLGASRFQVLRKVILPGSLPSVFSGARVGLGYAWAMIVIAEKFGASFGLGHFLWTGYTFMRLDVVVAAMIFLGIFGFLTDSVLVGVKEWKIKWARELAVE
ncbi:hypothetical protein AKJ62_03545 [candidate division MSBL1 archaeon SCGC-AAA259D14]|uniref:ABC transmembrane type-1 domain-containing protein n=1 Tax=candidate division MSBL1 archaeon SCGC-AAA259D14 TaxID=1698261 RepID=A0A133U4X2_9EURY|nr:hypothetical protein AKJ62_03545 [candidate division MSBL1 archaeon SCGC-AAA259D14]